MEAPSDIDDYGRVQFDVPAIKKMMLDGKAVRDVYVKPGPLLDQFNSLCARLDKSDFALSTLPPMPHSPEVEHKTRQANWMFPEELTEIDVREYLIGLCVTEEQSRRVHEEMDLYERYELIPVLHLMMYLVAHFRANKIIHGVGRGSSVASYVLFLLGVHKIDSLKYKLRIEDFLKD